MRRVAGFFLTAFCLAPAAALADAQFTADDIIQHFMKSKAATAAAPTPAPAASRPAAKGEDAPLELPLTGARRSVKLGARPAAAAETGGLDLFITFESGSDRLTEQAMRNLDTFADALQNPALAAFAFEVQGHTDAAGPAAANLTLSQRRAESVVAYLVGRGVAGSRLQARGYGESKPVMADPNHPRNRRVETRRIR